MKKYYIFFFILLIGCTERKSSSSNLNVENKNTTETDTLLRDKMLRAAFEHFRNKDFQKYYQISKEIEKNSKKTNDTSGIVSSNVNLGYYFLNNFTNDSAYFYLSKAEKLSALTEEKPHLETIIQYKSSILWSENNFAEAEQQAIKAVAIANLKNNKEVVYNSYLTIANSLVGMNNFEDAIFYYNKAMEISESLDSDFNKVSKAQIYNYLGIVYEKQNQHSKAIRFFEKGLVYKNLKKSDIKIYCYLTNNLAYSKFKLDDKASLHQFQKTLKIADSIKSIPLQVTSKTYLGEFYLAENDSETANFYLEDALQQAHKNNIFEDELRILQLLAIANPTSKSIYSDRYITLSDSLQNLERATRNKFARIEFETDEIINERNNLTIERETLLMQRWLIAGVSVFSLLSVFLWFKNKTQKAKTRELMLKQNQQKANEQIYQLMLSQQQKLEEGKNAEKQRISLELHDGVMGRLSAVRLNLYASLYKANLLSDESVSIQIDEIQSVEKEIRNIAHDLSVNLFSDNSNFIEIVKALFSRIENHSKIQFELQVSDAVNWDVINTTIKINLYRILQEALQNIEKYAEARLVSVTMHLSDLNEINVLISDNGNGFDTSQKKSGIGLANIKIRMEELSGKMTIESQISEGTKINLKIPI